MEPRPLAPALIRHGLMPALLVAVGLAWGTREALGRALRMDAASVIFLGLLLLVSLAEHFWPANPAWNYHLLRDPERGWSRLGRDLLYLFFVTQLSALLVNAVAARLQALVGGWGYGWGRPGLLPWPSAAPAVVRVALAFLLVEFCSYWLHRAAHAWPLLWQFHSTHHVVTALNGLAALRTHPVENACFHVVRHLPLLLLGAGADDVVTATWLGGALGILAHANLAVAEGPLGLVVNFPRYHAFHHSADLAESNTNFGCHTVLWDRLFGTFRCSAGAPAEVGVAPVGVRTLWQELGWPLYRRVR